MMMRKLFAVCVVLLTFVHPASSQNLPEFLRSHADSFPLVTMERSNPPFAKIYTMEGPEKSLEFEKRYYSAFRVALPAWLDGPLAWFHTLKGDENDVTKSLRWFIVPVDPADETKITPMRSRWGADERFPHFRKFCPGFQIINQQYVKKEELKPGKTYIIFYSFTQKERPEIRVSLIVGSRRGAREFGMLPTGNPHWGPDTASQATPNDPKKTAKEAAGLFRAGKKNEAFALLDKDCAAYIAAGTRFYLFYSAVWKEGQVGAGRVDREWNAAVYGWLQRKCNDLGAFYLTEQLTGNLSSAMIGINAYGAARQAVVPFVRSMEKREISLIPQAYPDQGPAIDSLQEIRKRKIPLGSPTRIAEIAFDGSVHAITGLPRNFHSKMVPLANLEALGGQWATALERYQWVCDWAEARRGSDEFEIENGWYSARSGMADTLERIGLYEAAHAENAAILAKDWPDIYANRSRPLARREQIDLEISLGRADAAMLAELDDLHTKLENNAFVQRDSWEAADITKARCLAELGKIDEAEALLTKLTDDGNRGARLERIRLRIATNRFDGLEGELLTVLANYREWGLKITEADVYSLYADLLEKTGRFQEAIAMRREAIRLERSFDLFVALPRELAKLSVTLARVGDVAGAKAAAAESSALSAKKDRIAARVADGVKAILAAAPATAPTAKPASAKVPPIELQPKRSLVIPVAGLPARGRLTLSNPGQQAVEGILTFDGIPADASWDGVTATVRLGKKGETQLNKVRIDPGSYILVDLVSGNVSLTGELTVTWASRSQQDQNSVWNFEAAEDGVAGAVIDAGEFRPNAFYSIPIHHHYQHATKDQPHAGLRLIASSTARIEMYDDADRPVFVDDNGNGDLAESGDSLLQDADGDGQPDISLKDGESSIRLHIFPSGKIPAEGLSLKIEALIAGKWTPVSEDKITP